MSDFTLPQVIINKLIDSITPIINYSKLSLSESNHWNHEYGLMLNNGSLRKFILLKFHLFNNLSYFTDVTAYLGGSPILAQLKSSDQNVTLGASSTQVIFINQTQNYSLKFTLKNLDKMDVTDLIDLFTKVKVTRDGSSLTVLNEYIKEKNLESVIELKLVKY
jgi:hypothetical protein